MKLLFSGVGAIIFQYLMPARWHRICPVCRSALTCARRVAEFMHNLVEENTQINLKISFDGTLQKLVLILNTDQSMKMR